MGIIQVPPGSSRDPKPIIPDGMREPAPPNPEFTPVLLSQLQDELARSRMREAFWISVVVHIVAILAIGLSPKFLPDSRSVHVATAEDIIQNRELTFLELPNDRQQPPEKAPDTKFMSDKNRIATSRNPSIDKKLLDELREARRQGSPAPPGPPVPQQPPAQQPSPQVAQQGSPQGGAQPQPSPPQGSKDSIFSAPPVTRPTPSTPSPFGGAMSPGTVIAEAARSSARTGFGGTGGEFSISRGMSSGKVRSDMDILSDTMGVDFAPYLARIRQSINSNWQNLIPESAYPPLMKRGKVSIQFAILKDGRVAGMRVAGASGDVSLDRAAWAGITASNPFPPLPGDFRGPYLSLRCHFYYNPDRNELE